MRSVVVVMLLLSGPAMSEPDKLSADKLAKAAVKLQLDAPTDKPVLPTDRTPGVNGVDALGRVLVPGAHSDAALWPNGMIIVPPDTGDENVLMPGSMQLPWWKPSARGPVSKELLDGIEGGVGTLIELLVPAAT